MKVTSLVQGGLYIVRCLDVLSSVAGLFTLPLFKAGQLFQQWVASSSFWAGAGWWAARHSVLPPTKTHTPKDADSCCMIEKR